MPINSNPYTNLINAAKKMLGQIAGGNYDFTVRRPTLASGDNIGTVVATGAKFHVEPAGPNWTEDRIPDLEYFEVCGDQSLFQLGDVIGGAAEIPKITISNKPEGQEFMGFKTDKLCDIEDMATELSYTNVAFDFMNSTSAGPDEYYQDVTSFNEPSRRAVLYRLPGLVEGMSLKDLTSGWTWSIAKIDYKSFVMVLYLDKPNRT